jgi:hypothetical protein
MNTNNTSWRHHYLPQFYLQSFTNNKGLFKIYDVEQNRFIKDGKWFSTESYFFEKNGNTTITFNEKDDFLEDKYYKDVDGRVAGLFNKIKSAEKGANFGLTDDDMPLFQYFVAVLFWRLPQNYNRLKYILQKGDLTKIGFLIKNVKGEIINNTEAGKEIINSPNMFKAMKFLLPTLLFPQLLDCKTQLHVQSTAVDKAFPALCSDNPIIFQDSILPEIYKDDFILPLTDKLLFIRGNKLNPNCLTSVRVDIDLILLKQAKKYVSCTDELYIRMLNIYYERNYSSIEEVKTKVFREVLES